MHSMTLFDEKALLDFIIEEAKQLRLLLYFYDIIPCRCLVLVKLKMHTDKPKENVARMKEEGGLAGPSECETFWWGQAYLKSDNLQWDNGTTV